MDTGNHTDGEMSATETSGGEALVRALAAHGVDLVFGIPGTHNLPIYAHLGRYGIRHVTPRHEQGAGYAADGYARASGRPGVAITTTGPALLNVAAAVGQAYSDSVPLIVVSPGMPLRHPTLAVGHLHEMRSQVQAMSGVAEWSHRATTVDEIGVAVARAFSGFRTGRPRPVHIEVPLDVLDGTEPAVPRHAPQAGRAQADPAAVRAAARLVRDAATTAVVLGGGARGAAEHCLALAELLGAPVVTTANGKGVVAEDHPLALGATLNLPSVQRLLADAEVVVAIGTELGESDFWCAPPRVGRRLVRIDIDPRQAFAGQAADVALVGDAAAVLPELLRELGAGREPRPGGRQAELAVEARAEAAAQAEPWAGYLSVLRETAAADAVITGDSARACYYGLLAGLPLGPEGRYLHPTGFGTLGYALPAAIGAKAALPSRQVIAVCGDGGFQFSAAELATAAEQGGPLPIVVFDNGGYGEIRDQMLARGDAPLAVDLPGPDFPALARAYGCHGESVASPTDFGRALSQALAADRPTLITIPEESR